MSTRSTTHFIDESGDAAIVYRHADGYPDGHGADLQEFFAAVEADTQDRRFNDPTYLAAKLVVWLARRFAVTYSAETNYEAVSHADERPLDFLSVGVVLKDPGDIEYLYEVDCGQLDAAGRPTVRCYETAISVTGPVTRGEQIELGGPSCSS